MEEQDYRRIVDKTNKVMRSRFTGANRPGSKTDEVIKDPKNSWVWEACEPYLEHLPEVFDQWKIENSETEVDLDKFNPYIKTLNDWGIIKKLYKKIDIYRTQETMKRERIVIENWDLAVDMIKDSPYNIEQSMSSVEVTYKQLKKQELNNGQTIIDWSPTPSQEKQVIYKLSEAILKECKIDSIDDYE